MSAWRAYAAVTAAYWAFMLTDGALRLLVLLHFNGLGFTPIRLAWLFVLYEAAGVATNLVAGWLAARFGLATTLFAGLAVQIAALAALAQLDPGWSVTASVTYVMAVQGASGVAKDLAKMSSKSAVKVLAPKGEGALFRWVAVLTGSKNAVKGLGFFLGAALLATVGFKTALWGMAAVLVLILLAVMAFLPKGMAVGKKDAKLTQIWSRDARINRLSLARLFLFGARDVWFVVGIPVYFQAVLSDGSAQGERMAFYLIGGFMALWTMAYGAVQAAAPQILRARGQGEGVIVAKAVLWAGILAPIPLVLAGLAGLAPGAWFIWALVAGLLAFGFVFALNSAMHSYLILAFSRAERVSMDVGFYYMANAAGRLVGTALSGISYQVGGLPLCLGTSAAMAATSCLLVRRLRTQPLTTPTLLI